MKYTSEHILVINFNSINRNGNTSNKKIEIIIIKIS